MLLLSDQPNLYMNLIIMLRPFFLVNRWHNTGKLLGPKQKIIVRNKRCFFMLLKSLFRKMSYLKYLYFVINEIWILLLILFECKLNMVCCSYVISQVYISFWSSFMTSVCVKHFHYLRNMVSIDWGLLWAFLCPWLFIDV